MARRKSGYVGKKYTGEYLGPRLKDARVKKGMTIQRLADEVGVMGNYISQMESGDKMPSMDTFIRLANTLDVTADDLLCDYLNAEKQVVNKKVNVDISSLDKSQQRFIEQLVALIIRFLKSRN